MAEKEIRFRTETIGGQTGLVADTRVYETQDGRIVGEDDPAASALVTAPGLIIDPAVVKRLRLSEKGQEAAPESGHPVASTVTEEKPAEVVRPLTVSGERPAAPPAAEEPTEAGEEAEVPAEEEEHQGRKRGKAHAEE